MKLLAVVVVWLVACVCCIDIKLNKGNVIPLAHLKINQVAQDKTPLPRTLSDSTINGTDGILCNTDLKQAWLDLVIVIEATRATASQWSAIVGNILTYVSQVSLNNTDAVTHTTRVAIFTYDSNQTVEQIYSFTDRQDLRGIQFALNTAKPNGSDISLGNIASGLRAAYNYLKTQDSFRVKGVVLYAATYGFSDDPVKAANKLKADMIKIATVSFDAANGVNTPKIAALASPGLALQSVDNIQSFGTAVAQLNCRCPDGYTQLVVGNVISYAECFYYQSASNSKNGLAACDGSTVRAVVNTPQRLEFVGQLASNWTDTPTSEINVGLVRYDATSPWIWLNGQSYNETAYPPFAQTPTTTDTYGYLSKKDADQWQLFSDDGTTLRGYVCQRRACDTSRLCDLTV